MQRLFSDLDRTLRGVFTEAESLERGQTGVAASRLALLALLLGASYGAFMGLFAVLQEGGPDARQLAANLVKVPLLFFLTLLVTFPSLCAFSALANSRLRAGLTLQLLLVSTTVSLAILASLGPVTGFFTLSTDSYPFMKLLNFGFFALSGFVGLGFLHRSLGPLFRRSSPEAPAQTTTETAETSEEDAEGADAFSESLRRRPQPGRVAGRGVVVVWSVIYALVGAQMGWILRPFVGDPNEGFSLFRERGSNVFLDVLKSLGDLLIY